MKTSTSSKSSARPLTVAVPDPVYRRVRIYCASRDITLSAFVTQLFEKAVADLGTELADVMAPVDAANTATEVAS
jgi:hypothetical protein